MKHDLHTRLETLAAKIDTAKGSLAEKAAWHDGHHLTAGELEARHAFLKKQLDGEIEDLEAHGHHVSSLERSVRRWVDGLEI